MTNEVAERRSFRVDPWLLYMILLVLVILTTTVTLRLVSIDRRLQEFDIPTTTTAAT